MNHHTSTLIIILFLNSVLFSQESNHQINLSEINEEIKALTNDSLIDDFWKQLYTSDQDLSNLGNSVIHTENWVKVLAFYNHFGFSSTKYFDSTKTKGHNYLWMTETFWVHFQYVNLSRMTYDRIVAIAKLRGHESMRYLNQNIKFLEDMADTSTLLKTEMYSIEEVVQYANEFLRFIEGENVCLGKWKVKDGCADLYLSEEGDYYISFGKYVKLDVKNDRFYYPYGSSYFYINENQELVLVNEEKGEEEIFLPLPTASSE